MRNTFLLAALLFSCAGAPRALHTAPPGVEKHTTGMDFL